MMGLLQKFAAVEIQADCRITEMDKDYCVQHQKAYETAISSFQELAFFELFSKCHSAAWNSSTQKPKYERKKDTLCFNGYFCRFRSWPFDGWELCDGMKEILYGLAHYETDSYRTFPIGFPELFRYHEIEKPLVEFPTCEKVKQMKLFKNNRVDLKFRSSEYAEQFVTKYLGVVY